MKLLFTNAGRRTYLIEYALDLNRSGVLDLEVFVCDTSKSTAAMWVCPEVKWFITPRVSDDPKHYARVLLAECRNRKIEVIIPLMDYELPILARWKARFAANGITVIVSSPDVIGTGLDKERCYRFCEKCGLPVPRTWYPGEPTDEARPPLLLKQSLGSGSVGLKWINAQDEIPAVVPSSCLLQERIVGDEYGMDVLNGFKGEFVHCSVRRKLSMRAGETDKAELVYAKEFLKLGPKVSAAFRHVGNMDLDFMVDHVGNVFFIDFNPRFGGGYPFTHAAGFNYLHFLLAICNGQRVELPSAGRQIVGAKGLCLFTYEAET